MATITALQPILERASSSWSSHDALVAFTSVEKDIQAKHPDLLQNELLSEAHKQFADRLGVTTTPDEDRWFGGVLGRSPAFPDTVAALVSLKKHFKLVVLSNVDNYTFNTYTRKILEPNASEPIFDLVITAQDVGSYKPDPRNFEYALKAVKEIFGSEKDQVLVTAMSLYHDHVPANVLGLNSAWIAREGQIMGLDVDAKYDFKFVTLMDMAEAREREDLLEKPEQ